MIAKKTPEILFDELLRAIGDSLLVLGFVRRGFVFRKLAHDNCGIIEFQRSDRSSDESLVFTVNLGVVCGDLLEEPTNINKTRIVDAHLRQRIGMLLPERPDKWWEITLATNLLSLAQELGELLLKKGWPYIDSHLATSALISLWESGQSPGLTAMQRTRYLAKFRGDE